MNFIGQRTPGFSIVRQNDRKAGMKKTPATLPIRLAALFLIIIAAAGVAWFTMIRMPSSSYSGPWQPLSEQEMVLSEQLAADVQKLAGEIGDRNVREYENYLAAADFIQASFEAAGYEVSRQEFETEGRACYNLEAEIEGTERPGEILVLGAHYDSVFGTPAANDNASGVAALLAIARAFAGDEPARTVRFVAFANEEPPFFQTGNMGSLVYARRSRERGENIVGMVSLETIGYYSEEPGSQNYPFPFQWLYPNTGNFLAFVGNTGSRGLLREGIRAFRENTAFPSEGAAVPSMIPGVGWSDHWAFWQEGYPGFMVTDTAPFRYPYYHTHQDTPDKLDYLRMTRAVTGLIKMSRELAAAGGN